MNYLKGWPFEPFGTEEETCGGVESGGGSPG